ncbi:MAG: LysM peptidoglycan-binding domain-containing M23 family metallopeptidase [Pseudomonadota bacterium]
MKPICILVLLLLVGCPAHHRRTTQPAQPIHGVWHKVKTGETLVQLAHLYRVPLADLEEINGLDHRDPLPVGKDIFVPGGKKSQPVVTRGKSTQQFIWPVPEGELSSPFGERGGRPHEGIDIAAPKGTAVLAAASGSVIYAGSGIKGYGNLVIIKHDNNVVTVYAHNSRNLVAVKDKVVQAQVIAEVGSTGRATGCHLHFEIRNGEVPQDPLGFVRAP